MSMCRVVPCVVGRGCLLWPMCSLEETLLAFALLHFILQRPNLPVTLDILTSCLCIPIPWWWKGHLFLVLALEGLIGLHRTGNISFFGIIGWGTELNYCDVELFALETNRDHSVVFEIPSKYCISNSFVDCESYDYPFLLRDSCLYKWIEWSSESNLPIAIHLSSLIPKMLIFTLAISCLTMSSLPWFIDSNSPGSYAVLFFTASDVLTPPDTSTTECHFCFGPSSSFFLELFLHSSPVAYWQ